MNWAWSNQIVHHSAVFFLRLYAQVKEVKSFTSVTSFEVHQKGIARLKKVLKLQPWSNHIGPYHMETSLLICKQINGLVSIWLGPPLWVNSTYFRPVLPLIQCSPENMQNQPFPDVLRNGCSWKFRNIHRKTPVFEFFLIKLQYWRSVILLKRDANAVAFLRVLRNF